MRNETAQDSFDEKEKQNGKEDDQGSLEAVQRALRRWSTTGRFVEPLYFFIKAGNRPSRNYNALKTHHGVTSYTAYSSDVPLGKPFDVLESSTVNHLCI